LQSLFSFSYQSNNSPCKFECAVDIDDEALEDLGDGMEAFGDVCDGMEALGAIGAIVKATNKAKNNDTRGSFSAEEGSDENGVLQLRSCQSFIFVDPASPWAGYMGEHNYMYLNKKVEKRIVIRLLEEMLDSDPLPVLKMYLIEVPSKVMMA
jgi:hypothetical protein